MSYLGVTIELLICYLLGLTFLWADLPVWFFIFSDPLIQVKIEVSSSIFLEMQSQTTNQLGKILSSIPWIWGHHYTDEGKSSRAELVLRSRQQSGTLAPCRRSARGWWRETVSGTQRETTSATAQGWRHVDVSYESREVAVRGWNAGYGYKLTDRCSVFLLGCSLCGGLLG
jgi:hypothetical protein